MFQSFPVKLYLFDQSWIEIKFEKKNIPSPQILFYSDDDWADKNFPTRVYACRVKTNKLEKKQLNCTGFCGFYKSIWS